MNMSISDLMKEADSLPSTSEERILILEEAIRIADSTNDISSGYQIRTELLNATIFGGFPKKAIIAYAWMLAQADLQAVDFEIDNLLWCYKWIINQAPDFPEINREQMEQLFEDMKSRYLIQGYSLRSYHYYRYKEARNSGRLNEAELHYKNWLDSPRDYMSDCRACEINYEVKHAFWLNHYEEALELAKPLISGDLGCTEVPHDTYGSIVLAAHSLGQVEIARDYFIKGYPMIKDNIEFTKAISEHLEYLTNTDLPKAIEVWSAHREKGERADNPIERFYFLARSAKLMQELADKQMSIDGSLLDDDSSLGVITVAKENADRILTKAQELADRFDARNGNDTFSLRLLSIMS